MSLVPIKHLAPYGSINTNEIAGYDASVSATLVREGKAALLEGHEYTPEFLAACKEPSLDKAPQVPTPEPPAAPPTPELPAHGKRRT